MDKSNNFMGQSKALMEGQMFDGEGAAETSARTAPNGHGRRFLGFDGEDTEISL